jgi:alkylation response protein AidB-like acyl-CoA dehydrogenase
VAYFSADPPDVAELKLTAARDWQRTRYENDLGWISGPEEYGGRGLSPAHELVYASMEAEYDVPDTGVLSVIGLGMIGPTILAHAQQHVKDRYLPAMYQGDVIACQLFSEPGAGSDLASVRTRATPVTGDNGGTEWVLDGQKVWTSIAQHAQIGMALCRTDPDVPKHKGITAFLVNMTAPGVEVRPLRQMSGGADFNEVFLTGVRVPDDHRLGEVNGGWRVALTTLMNERATVGSEDGGPAGLERLTALLLAAGTSDDRALRRDLSEVLTDMMATRYLNARAFRRMQAGVSPGPEMSVAKLMYAQNLTRAAHFASRVLGPRIIADTGEWGTYAWAEFLLATPALRILGGTEEIMKNILAERVLGLPKEPA